VAADRFPSSFGPGGKPPSLLGGDEGIDTQRDTHCASAADLADRGTKDGWSFEQYLYELCSAEISDRRQRRTARHLKQSCLPRDKTLATLKLERLPASVRRQLPSLCEGNFADRAENALAFGLPGRGKTHLLCAVGHELISRGYRVPFTPTFQLVQRLLEVKRDLALEQELRQLDGCAVVLIDEDLDSRSVGIGQDAGDVEAVALVRSRTQGRERGENREEQKNAS